MNNIKFFILISISLPFLSACATNSQTPEIPIQNLSCAELLQEIDKTEAALTDAQNLADNYRGGINGINTGGVVGVQGGSSSGVGIGVGISIGSPFGNSRHKRAKLEAEELKTKLIALQRQTIAKKC